MTDKDDTASTHHHHHAIHIFGRRVPMPRSRALRVLIGVLLIILGILGFLPVLGLLDDSARPSGSLL